MCYESDKILLKTTVPFLQKILAYKFDSTAPAGQATRLLWEHSLQYPIHSIMPLDLTGDGVKDLAVLSIRGLHILQVCYSLSVQTVLRGAAVAHIIYHPTHPMG